MVMRRILHEEFLRRRRRNPRYSLRAFARDLGVHHSTLSRILRGQQRPRTTGLTRFASRLRLDANLERASRDAESDAAVLATLARRGFRPDTRWIATVAGLTIDAVNLALFRLLRDGSLIMSSDRRWTRNEMTAFDPR
jgi:transcriptional regulator with XRE-family HTH domain